MFADASSLMMTTERARRRAKRRGPGADAAGASFVAALGPWRLAHSEQRTGLATERRRRVGPSHQPDRP